MPTLHHDGVVHRRSPFGHAIIIDYCNRPFADVRSMDRALVDAWNDTTSATDEVWISR